MIVCRQIVKLGTRLSIRPILDSQYTTRKSITKLVQKDMNKLHVHVASPTEKKINWSNLKRSQKDSVKSN